MIQILKNHKWAIILAFVASIIIAYPQLYLRYDKQVNSQGIELLWISDERAWLSRVREAYDGHPFLGNPYFKDGKSDPYLHQPLGSMSVAYLGKIFSLNINNTILLFRLFFSFLVFLLIYGFVVFFAREKLVALATSAFLFLGNSLFARASLFKILSGEAPSLRYVNYTRPVNPLMTSFFFYGFLLCFLLFLDTSTRLSARKKLICGILSALLLGLSFYDYFYTWTFLYSFLGVLILIFLFQKKWQDIKRAGWVLLGASIIAIPSFFNLYQATTFPTYQEVSQRLAILDSRAPVFGIVVPSLFFIFLLFFPKKWQNRYPFALALVTAPFIVLNQQLITGKVMQSGHYHWNYHLPLAIIFLSVIFFFWISKLNRPVLKKTAAILMIIIGIFIGLWVQNSSYAQYKDRIIDQQRYSKVLNWLSQNAEKDEVVFSDSETSRLIVIYTPLNVFYHPSARYSLAATTERLVNTLFLYYKLNGIGQDEAEALFFKDREDISTLIYGVYYRDATGDYRNIPDELLLDLAQKYKKSFTISTSGFFKEMLDEYEVKYFVWDKKNYPLWQLDQYPFLEKTIGIGDFVVYLKD